MKKDIDLHFSQFKLNNFSKLFWIGTPLYLFLSVIDNSLSQDQPWLLFLGIRGVFIIPYVLTYFFRKKINPKYVDAIGVAVFTSVVAGASFSSSYIGGLRSDYYFGILEISFAQFLVFPMGLLGNLLFEIIYITVYFPLNYIGHDIPQELLVKQLSNYVSFSLFKIAVANGFRKTIFDSFRAKEYEQNLEHQKEVRQILGELCHLFNNPLFISKTYLKKMYKALKGNPSTNEEPTKETLIYNLDKSFDAYERMEVILGKMLKIHSEDEAFKGKKVSETFSSENSIE